VVREEDAMTPASSAAMAATPATRRTGISTGERKPWKNSCRSGDLGVGAEPASRRNLPTVVATTLPSVVTG
jgi:hypothetical protein